MGSVDYELEQSLAAGENHVEWTVTVDQPELWWPWALGPQPLHDAVVEAWTDDELSHRRSLRTGLRRVEFEKWICAINGERLFLKGSNQGPTRMALARRSRPSGLSWCSRRHRMMTRPVPSLLS